MTLVANSFICWPGDITLLVTEQAKTPVNEASCQDIFSCILSKLLAFVIPEIMTVVYPEMIVTISCWIFHRKILNKVASLAYSSAQYLSTCVKPWQIVFNAKDDKIKCLLAMQSTALRRNWRGKGRSVFSMYQNVNTFMHQLVNFCVRYQLAVAAGSIPYHNPCTLAPTTNSCLTKLRRKFIILCLRKCVPCTIVHDMVELVMLI